MTALGGVVGFDTEDGLLDAVLAHSRPGVARGPEEEAGRAALLLWSMLVEPGDGVAGALIEVLGPLGALRAVWPEADETEGRAADRAPARLAAACAELDEDIPDGAPAGIRRWLPRMSRAVLLPALMTAARSRASLLLPGDADWPRGLVDLGPHAPLSLWCLGDAALLRREEGAVALVGARSATGYGTRVASEFAAGLAERGHGVVSGAAYGIDGAAHRAALAAGGVTVAVLAGGIDRFYPAGHHELIERIARDGAVVTEAPFGTPPTSWRFLQRNRLIAALSEVTVIVEAGARSGAINTANHAATLGRPVGVVPGPITSPSSAGCHLLLRDEGRQVSCVTSVAEMLHLNPDWRPAPDVPGEQPDDPRALRVLDALSPRRARQVDEIAARSGLAAREVSAVLGFLQLPGRVRQDVGGWVSVPPR